MVVRRGGGGLEAVELPNAVGAAREAAAFELDPAALLGLLRRLEREGGGVVAVFHSHLDAPATPSPADAAGAFCGGEPLWPGAEHVIVSLRGGRAAEVRRYRAERGELRPAVEVPAAAGAREPTDSP